MRKLTVIGGAVLGATLVFGVIPLIGVDEPGAPVATHPYTRVATAQKLENAYLRWRNAFEANGADRNLVVSLGWAKGLSAEPSSARGTARFDLVAGSVAVEVDGLAPGGWEAWLVDNLPGAGRTTLPEEGDRIHRLGALSREGGRARLIARLGPELLTGFQIDRVIVTRAGDRPEHRPVLVGAATLFERIFTRTSRPSMGRLANASGPLGLRPAFAVDSPFNSMDPLIAAGADLFFNETFNGNGRTCATCHPAENNFTIDPRFISRLPANDPLFVPETVPALAGLDNPVLLRQLGLINVHADGFENPPVQRAVQHLLGLSRYLVPGNQSVPPLQRTGWGGDGAPGSGTLREFPLGAVANHMTRSLDRVPGVDFRVPTDEELDAIEAFLLVLGRQDFPDISEITLSGPIPEAGRELFQVFAVDAALCTFCHQEGGANGPTTGLNFNFDVGISDLAFVPAKVIAPGAVAPDGGFGLTPLYNEVTGDFEGFGTFDEDDGNQRRFNSQPAIEAVDTGPFFHDHSVATIEEAVDFYNSDEFLGAPSALPIKMSTTEVEAIAAFLRVMNTLENIRSSNELAQAAVDESDRATSKRLASLASFDTQDGYQVLDERFLHPDVIAKLKLAFAKELQASNANGRPVRNRLLADAIQLKEQARSALVVE